MRVKAYKSWRWAMRAAAKQKYHTVFPIDADGLYRVRPMTQREKERAIRNEEMTATMRRVFLPVIERELNKGSSFFGRLRSAR